MDGMRTRLDSLKWAKWQRWFPVAGAGLLAFGLPLGMGHGWADAPEGGPIELPDELAEPNDEQVELMVGQLSDDAYLVRQAAMLELWQLGDRALPFLRKACEGNDPESVARARDLVLYISAGVLFDSSEEVKGLVMRFSRGDVEVKKGILSQLTELGQWKQVIHLARMERDPKVRATMAEYVQAAAAKAARAAVAEDDLELAAEILELTGDDDQNMVLRAWFYCQRGLYQEELEKAKVMLGEEGARWRLALYRAGGNLKQAIHEAEQLQRPALVDMLKVLQGDPRPWLRRKSESMPQDEFLSLACRIQEARLSGKQGEAKRLASQLFDLAGDEKSGTRAIAGLAANGFSRQSLELVERFDPVQAFDFYDSSESPQRALEVLGIAAGARPPYREWVHSTTVRALDEEDRSGYQKILMLAGFLAGHGEDEHVMSVVRPLMDGLQESGEDVWFELIQDMSLYGLGPQAIELVKARGNEDGEADLAVKKLFKLNQSAIAIWEVLKKRNQKNLGRALDELAWLAGLRLDSGGQTAALHQALMEEVDQADELAKVARYEALLYMALHRHEIEVASEVADILAAKQDRWKKQKMLCDSALFRWEKLEPVYAALEEADPADYNNLVRWGMVLRAMKQTEKAEEVLKRASVLTMGSVEAIQRVSVLYSSSGYRDEAYQLVRRAAMMSDPGKRDFEIMVVYLASYGSDVIRRGDWAQAASVAEVYARFMMHGRGGASVGGILNARFNADFARGMAMLKRGERSKALALLDACRRITPGSGTLADDFFPLVFQAGIGAECERWFEDSYRHVKRACDFFPNGHNSHNTAAWLASRAVRRLDDAQRHAETALRLRPYQGAYLDTMAEVWFAKGKREKAVEWSEKAVAASISHAQGAPRDQIRVLMNHRELSKQLKRFKHDPLPLRGGKNR